MTGNSTQRTAGKKAALWRLTVYLPLTVLIAACQYRHAESPFEPSIASADRCAAQGVLSARAAKLPSAHRLGAKEIGLADNSQAALLRAVAERLPIAEVDLRSGRDGTLFLMHDRRLSDSEWQVPVEWVGRSAESLNAAELERICARDMASGCVPTLEMALRVIQGSCTTMQIDLKGDFSQGALHRLAALLISFGLGRQVLIQTDPLEELRQVRKVLPETPVIARIFSEQQLDSALALSPEIIQLDEEMLSPEIRARLVRSGVKILIKTLGEGDNPERWRKVVAKGADIILTDFPRRMLEELAMPAIVGGP
ncbi:MAG: hypothetical protein DCC75_00215 [Proteobacteria bacterium]|nr:MAG: hypothetical protein DCC75_00215 [Pseudomonadota bacterium]